MNPGIFISLEIENDWFTWLYIAYGACVVGYLAGCIPLVFLDGTFLKDRYKGTLLAATAYDGDNGLFSLAFCVCDIENKNN